MIGSVIGALVVGLIGVFAIVIAQGIVSGQSTVGWPTVLVSIVTNIAPVIGIVAIGRKKLWRLVGIQGQ